MQHSAGGTGDAGDGAAGREDEPPDAYRPGELRVAVRRAGPVRIVAVGGELDHDSADGLRAALAGPGEEGLARILVDLADLRFCDSTGLNVLLRARQEAEPTGVRLEVAGPRPAVARLLAVTGADTVLRIHPSVAVALAADRPPPDGPGPDGGPAVTGEA
ncbi:STAS domain-containing protein [Kitasatospora sp. NPDC002551]|uniref:STAS domain-containing protein n=1 Tax=unclassified Kitasatospora TaxID=2633591 RepID=UPI0033289DA9